MVDWSKVKENIERIAEIAMVSVPTIVSIIMLTYFHYSFISSLGTEIGLLYLFGIIILLGVDIAIILFLIYFYASYKEEEEE